MKSSLTPPAEVGELLLADVEGHLAHSELATDIRHRGARLRLLQGMGNLFIAILRAFHGPHLLLGRGLRIGSLV